MKINFKDEAQFAKLEDMAIDGQLNYEDFPPREYKYFSKLAKLGYNNRHKGWSVEICLEKQQELKNEYIKQQTESEHYLQLIDKIHSNILASSELVRNIYKSNSKDEILSLALQVIEKLTDETGFVNRIERKL
ncbi:MAG: hypothetical protein UE295_10795 [Acutalibacteraceae bacterium]|nr:hypothetical protein [Acutalibacteraceae bacterium]